MLLLFICSRFSTYFSKIPRIFKRTKDTSAQQPVFDSCFDNQTTEECYSIAMSILLGLHQVHDDNSALSIFLKCAERGNDDCADMASMLAYFLEKENENQIQMINASSTYFGKLTRAHMLFNGIYFEKSCGEALDLLVDVAHNAFKKFITNPFPCLKPLTLLKGSTSYRLEKLRLIDHEYNIMTNKKFKFSDLYCDLNNDKIYRYVQYIFDKYDIKDRDLYQLLLVNQSDFELMEKFYNSSTFAKDMVDIIKDYALSESFAFGNWHKENFSAIPLTNEMFDNVENEDKYEREVIRRFKCTIDGRLDNYLFYKLIQKTKKKLLFKDNIKQNRSEYLFSFMKGMYNYYHDENAKCENTYNDIRNFIDACDIVKIGHIAEIELSRKNVIYALAQYRHLAFSGNKIAMQNAHFLYKNHYKVNKPLFLLMKQVNLTTCLHDATLLNETIMPNLYEELSETNPYAAFMMAIRNYNNLTEAVRLLDKVVELDPNAYCYAEINKVLFLIYTMVMMILKCDYSLLAKYKESIFNFHICILIIITLYKLISLRIRLSYQ